MKRRQLYLVLALLATFFAVWWVSTLDDEDTAAPQTGSRKTATAKTGKTRTAARQRTTDQSSLLAQLVKAQNPREALPELESNPFASISFDPPPPKVEQPKPTAPPLRFKFMGKLAEGDKYAVFLDDGGNMVVARQGDTLGGTYRVMAISEHAILFEYKPLNTTQTLNF